MSLVDEDSSDAPKRKKAPARKSATLPVKKSQPVSDAKKRVSEATVVEGEQTYVDQEDQYIGGGF
jgi:hypothetical protein